MVRVVFDTVVLVRALLNRRSRWAHLVFDRDRSYQLIVSGPTLREALQVVRRPELAHRFTVLPGRNVAALFEILNRAEAVEIDEIAFTPVCRDPKDDKFLATAQAAGADYLVSEDEDLLVLKEFEGTVIVDAETFLDVLDQTR